MGDTTTRLIGPDTAGSPDAYTAEFTAAALARMNHLSFHVYSGNPANPATTRGGIQADWLSETSVWCEECNNNLPPPQGEWALGSAIGDALLGDLKNGFTALLTWEGFDAFSYPDNRYTAWGHIGCIQNGDSCTTMDVPPRIYTIRGRAWPEATVARAVRPGMVRRGLSTTLSNLPTLAFYDAATGKFSIVGHNKGISDVTINGEIQNLPALNSLYLYETNATQHFQRMDDIAVTGNQFSVTLPADTFFYIGNTVYPKSWSWVWLPVIRR